jgi:hypothetical protein
MPLCTTRQFNHPETRRTPIGISQGLKPAHLLCGTFGTTEQLAEKVPLESLFLHRELI